MESQFGSETGNKLQAQVERILHSQTFGGSETLRHLLQFLSGAAIQRPGQTLREKDIALGVFQRAEHFDPQNDSVVRVQIGRLRAKLAEYYLREGASDPLIVEIPRGGYSLSAQTRSAVAKAEPIVSVSVVETDPHNRLWMQVAIGFGLTLALAGAYAFGKSRSQATPVIQGQALEEFWAGFLGHTEGPLLVFGNPRFIGSDFSGMRYSRDTDDPRDALIDTFTSVGDLAGVFEITRQFSLFGKPPTLKRGQLLTWDAAVDRDLVVVGSSMSNRILREHPFLQEFQFKDRTEEPRIGVGAILNRHPDAGEEAAYFGPESRPYQFDYAVVAMVHGLNPTRRTLVLAGITSHGTQAAAEFVCREQSVRLLLDRLHQAGGDFPASFEFLFKVKVNGGVPVQPEIVSLRIRKD